VRKRPVEYRKPLDRNEKRLAGICSAHLRAKRSIHPAKPAGQTDLSGAAFGEAG
jgi:hypothetical protein